NLSFGQIRGFLKRAFQPQKRVFVASFCDQGLSELNLAVEQLWIFLECTLEGGDCTVVIVRFSEMNTFGNLLFRSLSMAGACQCQRENVGPSQPRWTRGVNRLSGLQSTAAARQNDGGATSKRRRQGVPRTQAQCWPNHLVLAC